MKTYKQICEELEKSRNRTPHQQKPIGSIRELQVIVEDRQTNLLSYQAYSTIQTLGSDVAFTNDVPEKLNLIAEQSTKLAYLMLLVIGQINGLENNA